MNAGLDYINKHRRSKNQWKPLPTAQDLQNRRKAANEAVNRRKSQNRTKITEYLSRHPCLICNESDCDCLEFHHLDQNKKEYNVSELLTYSWAKIDREIQKCVVLCANCHRKEHARLRRNELSLL